MLKPALKIHSITFVIHEKLVDKISGYGIAYMLSSYQSMDNQYSLHHKQQFHVRIDPYAFAT